MTCERSTAVNVFSVHVHTKNRRAYYNSTGFTAKPSLKNDIPIQLNCKHKNIFVGRMESESQGGGWGQQAYKGQKF